MCSFDLRKKKRVICNYSYCSSTQPVARGYWDTFIVVALGKFVLLKQLLLFMPSFSLRNNNIGSKGARFLSEALKMNQVLVSVKWVSIFKSIIKKENNLYICNGSGRKNLFWWCYFERYSSASKTIQLRRRELRLSPKCCSATASWCL